MADVTLQVAFREGEPDGEYHRFGPGSTISGQIRLMPQASVNSRRVLLRLGWHTEGRGTRASGKIEEIEIAQGSLSQGIPLSYDFAFRLPLEPWSYAGHYISIIWELEVIVDRPMARDINLIQPFILALDR
jgi:hypothetical protein